MLESLQFEALRRLGLNQNLLPLLHPLLGQHPKADPVRITEIHRDALRLEGSQGPLRARVHPQLLNALQAQGQRLAVGDWVLAEAEGDQHWVREHIPPLNSLNRRDPEGRLQPLVSNVDCALLVLGLDHDFNLARLDRYLVLTRSADVPAVVVLSKADLCAQPAERLKAVRRHLAHSHLGLLDVLAVDTTSAASCEALSPYLGLGQTLVLLGSSGAGKSTLTNSLCGHSEQLTGAVRMDDSRGRHTTTSRSLHRCQSGACIIDTPGLRGLALDADAATVAQAFDDVQELAQACRFRNCSHGDEPGCAVRESLGAERLKSYEKLQREARRGEMTALERREQLARWKSVIKSVQLKQRLRGRD
ncbi:ribosome small subunit-dependent GTPase A [Pelomonas sp. SE-A7]|uniref:ribosome small subunit-dependent GTPase A n=1 Tax=Pelomonas sp. SE-A7 TaxID=3054953 RepID=UPI00259CF42C|nr:ribosome small subunit-dependent GTPase A [Pelomonas sp. SE-A7]MDM4766183.1 ribosome small subunit-dependent GTPase A [Pelomonas sp. SE-A7]